MTQFSAQILRNPSAWIALHWVTAFLMVALVASAIIARDMPPGPGKGWTYNLHKSLGIAVLAMTLGRLLYRRRLHLHRAVGPRWQHLAAQTAHVLLYALLVAMPVTGYLSAGNGVDLFWLIQLPKALPDALGDAIGEVHVALQYMLYAVVAAHVAGALAHHYFWRDRALTAMLPGSKARHCRKVGHFPGTALVLVLAMAAVLPAIPAMAQLREITVSSNTALGAAKAASDHCRTAGHSISITVVGASGEIVLQLFGDGTGPHTAENSFRKAYTSLSYGVPSREIGERLKADPGLPAVRLANITPSGGGLPIMIGGKVVGAIGASGSPTAALDEECVAAGIAGVQAQLR